MNTREHKSGIKKVNSNVRKREYNDEWNTAIELPQRFYSRKKLV